uniref:Uncharacterized protein n=1 Tax=Electrophorus electricus TaxID=8005 RepID=A0AAY5E7I8_ELEEL
MGHKEAVEILLGAGAQVDLADGDGRTALSVAALCVPSAAGGRGHGEVVSLLLEKVDGIDGEGRTALCLAAAKGSVEVVRTLLDRGLDENHKDDLGWTPLHAAACEGHRSTCAVLTERGSMARVGELDVEGRTPLILAAQEGHGSTVRLLLDRDERMRAYPEAPPNSDL